MRPREAGMSEQSDVPRTSDEVADPDRDASAQEEDQQPPAQQGDPEWPAEADRETPESAEAGDAAES
jgi:hypothetical protein